MYNFFNNLHWPQYWLIAIILISLCVTANGNGKPKLDSDKEPQKHSFVLTFMRWIAIVFLLAAGGFFG